MRHLIAPMVCAIMLASCAKPDAPATTFYTELRSVDKLVLASMTITKMATVDDMSLPRG